MRAASTNYLILLCFSRLEREWLIVFVCALFAALAVPLGDFTSFSADSPPARAAALTAPDGGSPCNYLADTKENVLFRTRRDDFSSHAITALHTKAGLNKRNGGTEEDSKVNRSSETTVTTSATTPIINQFLLRSSVPLVQFCCSVSANDNYRHTTFQNKIVI
jgi:hypothetical protein